MLSLKEKYKKPIPFMKWLRKTRNKISKEIHNLNNEERHIYFKKGAEECRESIKDLKENDIYFSTIVNDDLIKPVLIIFNDMFDSFQWVWDHQEEVYNATRGKSRLELVEYFKSIYQYIQNN